MSDLPEGLRFTKSHEWVKADDDGTVRVGITDHAQDALGDLVYVETPEVGTSVDAGEACAVVESVKAASDIYAPVSGEIIEANETLADAPETVNQDPYGEGWIMRLRPSNPADIEGLLGADAYQAMLEEDESD